MSAFYRKKFSLGQSPNSQKLQVHKLCNNFFTYNLQAGYAQHYQKQQVVREVPQDQYEKVDQDSQLNPEKQSINTNMLEQQAQIMINDKRRPVKNISKFPYNCIVKIVAYFHKTSNQSTQKTSDPNKIQDHNTGIATFIGPRILITSAHVLIHKYTQQLAYKVELIIETQLKQNHSKYQAVPVQKMKIHHQYLSNSHKTFQKHDIALLQIGNQSKIQPNRYLKIKWDYSFEKFSDRKVKLITFKNNNLNQIVRYQQEHIPKRQLLHTLMYLHTTASGDSGAPVLIREDPLSENYYLIGIHKGFQKIQQYNFCILLNQFTVMKSSKDIFSEMVESSNLVEDMKYTQNYDPSSQQLRTEFKKLQRLCSRLQIQNNQLYTSFVEKENDLNNKIQDIKDIENMYNKVKKTKNGKIIEQYQLKINKLSTDIREKQQKVREKNIEIFKLKQNTQIRRYQSLQQQCFEKQQRLKNTQKQLNELKQKYEEHCNQINQIKKLYNARLSLTRPNSAIAENQIEMHLQQQNHNESMVNIKVSETQNQYKENEEDSDDQLVKQKQCKEKFMDIIKSIVRYFKSSPPSKKTVYAKKIQDPQNKQDFVKYLIQQNSKKQFTQEQLSKQLNIKYNDNALKLDNMVFSMKKLVSFKWQEITKLRLANCKIADSDWKILVENISAFPNLKVLKLYGNLIKTVTQNELAMLKNLSKLWFRNGANSTNPVCTYRNSESWAAMVWFWRTYRSVDVCFL